jgi:F420-non-reducing hydrogenase small subunit
MAKLKVALYWGASCGGCEIAVLEIGEKILDFAAVADIVFWPVAVDFKYHDVEQMPDKYIDLCLYNGAIRTSENLEIAQLLRAKSKVLAAFGACACFGGIPALANQTDRSGVFRRAYFDAPSVSNQSGTLPRAVTDTPHGELELPAFYNTVVALRDVVDVEYFVPGCPPVADQIWAVIEAVVTGQLPAPGSVVGAGEKTVCDECPREKQEKKIKRFVRPHEIIPEPNTCLLEQGIVCLGPATRAGCKARCIEANMPCRGCYGPPAGVVDQGAKMLSALASVIDSQDPDEIAEIVGQIADPLGTFYRFGLSNSLLKRVRLPAPEEPAAELGAAG